MLIDWFTVGAQGVNFLVLLWLMKRFLYKPILAAIDAREKRIAAELVNAAHQQSTADALQRDLVAKTGALDGERAGLMAAAVAAAGVAHERLLAQSRAAVTTEQQEWQARWAEERTSQNELVGRLITTEVFAIARRALGELAGVDLEDRMVTVMLTRLRDMPRDAAVAWANAARRAAVARDMPKGTVRTRFELQPSSRTLIQTEIDATCSGALPLYFETAADSCGIEILVGGQRIAWSIDEYVHALQAKVLAVGTASGTVTPKAGDLDAFKPPMALAS